MTYDDLVALAHGAAGEFDPLIDPDRPGSFSITPEGLLIVGSGHEGYMPDMLIRIEPDGTLRAWERDPEDMEGEPNLGREWVDGGSFADFDSLNTWAYLQ